MFEVAPLDRKGRCPGTPLTEAECQQIKQRIKDYRISKDQLDCLQERLKQYAGTHHFHNFTKGESFNQVHIQRPLSISLLIALYCSQE
jgi:tRNA U38,U39,U40 pseudouridine synthase TruA